MSIFRSFILLLSIASTTTVLAEHEEDHRYTVEGFVLDANEKPLLGSEVSISLENKTLKFTTTDDQGFYSLQLHLHDTDWGKDLDIKAGDSQATIKITFERGDKHTPRVHKTNFVGGKLVES